MTPERWKRIQEWHDGGGTQAERREVEQWVAEDTEAAELLAQMELSGELLREAVDEQVAGMQGSIWDDIAPDIRKIKPVWNESRRDAREATGASAAPADQGAGEELPLKGWLLAMMAVASLLLVISMVQPGIKPKPADPGDDAVAENPVPVEDEDPDHSIEIEAVEIAGGSILVYEPPDNAPAIIWVSYDEEEN